MKKLVKNFESIENSVEAYMSNCAICMCRGCDCPCAGGSGAVHVAQMSGDMNNLNSRRAGAHDVNWRP